MYSVHCVKCDLSALKAAIVMMIKHCIFARYSDVSSEMFVFICHSYQMQDWDGKLLAEANAKKHTLPSFFPITYRYPIPRDWDTVAKVCTFVVSDCHSSLALVHCKL